MSRVRIAPSVARAINRHAHKIDAYARKNYGISGKQLLARTVAAEGGGTTKHPKVSSADARGPAQFIPSTRAAYVKQYGIDPWRSDDEAIRGMIIHLKGTGVAGYNPGLPSYENLVLGQRTTGVSQAGGGKGDSAGSRRVKYFEQTRAPKLDLGGTKVDWDTAITDALLEGSKGKRRGSLLGDVMRRVDSGAYSTTTDPKVTKGKYEKRYLKVPGDARVTAKGGKTDIEEILALAKSMGLSVREHPKYDRVDPVHTQGSYHYQKAKTSPGAAGDVSGNPAVMAKFARIVARRWGKDVEELIYRGPGSTDAMNIKRGKRVGRGFYSAHTDHVHVADID